VDNLLIYYIKRRKSELSSGFDTAGCYKSRMYERNKIVLRKTIAVFAVCFVIMGAALQSAVNSCAGSADRELASTALISGIAPDVLAQAGEEAEECKLKLLGSIASQAGYAEYNRTDSVKNALAEGPRVLSCLYSNNSDGENDERETEPTFTSADPLPVTYALTDAERREICEVVMVESGNEPYEGQLAVAQCILDGCRYEGMRPIELIKAYKYTAGRKSPSKSVEQAVSDVFDKGVRVVEHRILYFYNPARNPNTFHETQKFIIEIGNHRFFDKKS